MLCVKGQLTLQSYTIHGESSGQLGGNFHAAANQGLSKHVLEGLVKVGAVAQLADHGDSILKGKNIVMNKLAYSILHTSSDKISLSWDGYWWKGCFKCENQQ